MRRTKLVCTIGPASADRLRELMEAGMDVARLNLSHGTADEHRAVAGRLRAAEREQRQVAIVADLPGPKLRLGELPGGEMALETGARVRIAAPGAGADPHLPVSYAGLAGDVRAGDRLMLADGAVELRVTATNGASVNAEVVRGGRVRSGAGLNAPSERISLPAVTARDRAALETVRQLGVDYVAQSFVRSADDIRQLRALLGPTPIMAKIETRAAVEHLPAILDEADAVMLARGDLGVEIPFAEVPLIQKRVIDACVRAAKPIVVATQMLESMVSAPRPTRAEASDVANAVLDGADAVMLSAETAIGAYPVLAASAAVGICEAAESDPALTHHPDLGEEVHQGEAAAIARAAVDLSGSRAGPPVAGIACFTRSGQTARLLSRLRPGCPITALTPDESVARRMVLLRSVTPVLAATPADTDEMLALLDRTLRTSGVPDGSRVVLVASIPFGRAGTNFVKLHSVGSLG